VPEAADTDAPRPPARAELGFGSSRLVGGRTRREALRLLDAAWEAGIRHFDTARLYGSGDAEAVIGAFAQGRRDELTIATKFGLEPLPQNAGTSLAKVVLRPVLRRSRRLLRIARDHSGAAVRRGRYSPEAAEASLVASLRQLRTEYVDVLLMHDCSLVDWIDEEARDAMAGFVASGRVRTVGSASSAQTTREILLGGHRVPPVVQFESDAANRNVEAMRALGATSQIVTFGVMGALRTVSAALERDPTQCRRWQDVLGTDITKVDQLGSLLLAHALWRNPSGVVLFSSGRPERIAAAGGLVGQHRLAELQLAAFDDLVTDLLNHHDDSR
jgi:D-threo-aldose 1-dehydrogenase